MNDWSLTFLEQATQTRSDHIVDASFFSRRNATIFDEKFFRAITNDTRAEFSDNVIKVGHGKQYSKENAIRRFLQKKPKKSI